MSTDPNKIFSMFSFPLWLSVPNYITASYLGFLKMYFKHWLCVPDSCPRMYYFLLATLCLWRQRLHRHFAQKQRSWPIVSWDDGQQSSFWQTWYLVLLFVLPQFNALSLGHACCSHDGRSKANGNPSALTPLLKSSLKSPLSSSKEMEKLQVWSEEIVSFAFLE